MVRDTGLHFFSGNCGPSESWEVLKAAPLELAITEGLCYSWRVTFSPLFITDALFHFLDGFLAGAMLL